MKPALSRATLDGPHHRVNRLQRAAAGCVLALTATLSASSAALAQGTAGNWWDNFTGINTFPNSRDEARPRREQKADVLNDLRPNAVPMRSEEMLSAMDAAIARHQQIVSKGGWPKVPGGRTLRPGDDDERVPILRKRLIISGDLKPRQQYYESYNFNDELEAAVRRFQERHGIRTTGRVDLPTLAALNVTAQDRLAQLKLNLARIEELSNPQRIEERYILVNIPSFQLEAVERGQVQLRHRVIVGRTERQSPSLKATVRALNFFPYWRVPDSVAHLDLIPRLRKEPDYIIKEKIRIFSGHYQGPELDPNVMDWTTAEASKIKFKQDPGPQNALGLVRIDMPNEHGVYMHDTPMKKLFEQRGRSFSAGCVRVQDVFKLAEWIARYEQGWDQPGRVEDVLAGGQALDLTLTRQVPVYFAYITAWAEPGGNVEFRPDLYNRDGAADFGAGSERDPSDPPPPSQSLAP